MRIFAIILGVVIVFFGQKPVQNQPLTAQKYAPVWGAYLPRICLLSEREDLGFEFTFHKEGGPEPNSNHAQMYILGYLEQDEAEILALAKVDKLISRKSLDKHLLLEELIQQKLVVTLGSEVAQQASFPVITVETKRKVNGGYCYDFKFEFENEKLFKSATSLKNFKGGYFDEPNGRWYKDKLKLMAFVPVNDCKYADKVPGPSRTLLDYAHYTDINTIIHYFKPLPYRFEFKQIDDDDDDDDDKNDLILVYID